MSQADTAADTARALDSVRPQVLVFSATDVWPELVRQAAWRGVCLGLISATLAPDSTRRRGASRALLRDGFAALDRVGAIDQADADALVELGVRPDRVVVTGDTRHDAAAARATAVRRDAPHVRAIATPGTPILVAGSTWPSDERELVPALARLRARHPLAVVIAPHEPSRAHLADLERRLRDGLGEIRIAHLSDLEKTHAPRPTPHAPWDVCLVDRTGVLADLYAEAAIAFVAGASTARACTQ